MKIGIACPSVFPWETRLARIARSLRRAGHEVTILCRRRQSDHCQEAWEGIPIACLPEQCIPFRPRWNQFIFSEHERRGWDVLIARDIKVASVALFPRRVNCPLLLDMAENYPAAVSVWRKSRPVHWVTRNRRFVQYLEDWILRRVDHIAVVIEENRDRLLRRRVRPEMITVIPNYAPRDMAPAPEWQKLFPEDFSATHPLCLSYIGILEPFKYELMLRAMAEVQQRRLPVRLEIIGGDGDLVGCKEMASRLGLGSDYVVFHGHQPYEIAVRLLQRGHVGLLLNRISDHTNTTIPYKLFEYLMMGLPVLSTAMIPVRRILDASHAGVVVDPPEPGVVADAIESLLTSRKLIFMSERGRACFWEAFNWEAVEHQLLHAVEVCAARGLKSQ